MSFPLPSKPVAAAFSPFLVMVSVPFGALVRPGSLIGLIASVALFRTPFRRFGGRNCWWGGCGVSGYRCGGQGRGFMTIETRVIRNGVGIRDASGTCGQNFLCRHGGFITRN